LIDGEQETETVPLVEPILLDEIAPRPRVLFARCHIFRCPFQSRQRLRRRISLSRTNILLLEVETRFLQENEPPMERHELVCRRCPRLDRQGAKIHGPGTSHLISDLRPSDTAFETID
jgi:hypothetical protein